MKIEIPNRNQIKKMVAEEVSRKEDYHFQKIDNLWKKIRKLEEELVIIKKYGMRIKK